MVSQEFQFETYFAPGSNPPINIGVAAATLVAISYVMRPFSDVTIARAHFSVVKMMIVNTRNSSLLDSRAACNGTLNKNKVLASQKQSFLMAMFGALFGSFFIFVSSFSVLEESQPEVAKI